MNDDVIDMIKKAQTQKQIRDAIFSNGRAFGKTVEKLVKSHYKSIYMHFKKSWSKANQKQPTDLNDAKTMVISAVRVINTERKMNNENN